MDFREVSNGDFQPIELKGHKNLPRIGERCLFLLRSWTDRPVDDFRAFGYRDDVDTIFLPLHKTKLHILSVKGWFWVGGDDFFDGHF